MSWKGKSSISLLVVWLAACGRPVVASIDRAGEGYAISYPSAHTRIELSEPGFEIQTADPHRPLYVLANDRTGVELTIRFERPSQCKTSHECRDLGLLRLREARPDVRGAQSGEIEAISYFEYDAPPRAGIDLKHRHLHAQFVSAELWVDVHLSKVQYEASDRELFVRAVRATRLNPM
jgi:hypothetical protein